MSRKGNYSNKPYVHPRIRMFAEAVGFIISFIKKGYLWFNKR
jgi:hypothetical protein